MRSLYDTAYLDSNCTLPFDGDTNVDNTVWTFATSYGIAWVAVIGAILLLMRQGSPAILMALYFLITGIGHAVTGASHQFTEDVDDWEHRILAPIGIAIILFGNAFLMRTGLQFFFYSNSLICNLFWILANAGIILVTILLKLQIVAGVALAATYFGMAILYVWVMSWGYLPGSRLMIFLKFLAMLVNIGGLVVQYVLSRTCGVGSYEGCFQECPLPNPAVFNQNAIFHICLIAGLLLLGDGELGLPSHVLWDYYGDDISDWETRKSVDEEHGGQ